MLDKYFEAFRRVGTPFWLLSLDFCQVLGGYFWSMRHFLVFLKAPPWKCLAEKTTYKETPGLVIFGTALLTWILGVSLALVQ